MLGDVRDSAGEEMAEKLGASASFHHHDVTNETEWSALVEQTLDALADHLETHLDLDALLAAAEEVKTAELSATG